MPSFVYNLLFLLKFIMDVMLLQYCFKKKGSNMNHSSSTLKLFYARVLYDFIVLNAFLVIFSEDRENVLIN